MSVLEGRGLGEAGNRINYVSQQGFTTLSLTGRSPPTSPILLFPSDRHTFRQYCGIGTLCLGGGALSHPHRVVYTSTQVVNFTVIPAHLRFVPVGVVSLFWSTFLARSLLPLQEGAELLVFGSLDTYLSAVNARERQFPNVERAAEKPIGP